MRTPLIPFVILFFLLLVFALPQSPTSEPLLAKARSMALQNQLVPAETAARGYLSSHANSADGHFLLGYILFRQAKAKESLAEYTEGAKYRTPAAVDLKVVASDYVVLGDFADADKWFTKVVEWAPDDAQAWYDLGRTKYNENRFDEAITAFTRALQINPANSKAEDNLGLSYQGGGHNQEAIAAYQRAIALKPDNPDPHLNLGSLYTELNRTPEALPLLTKARELANDDFRVHRELGKAYLHLNNLEAAQTELETAVKLAPTNAPLHFMLAQVYRKRGFLKKAKAETERYSSLK